MSGYTTISTTTATTSISAVDQRVIDAQALYDQALKNFEAGTWWDRTFGLKAKLDTAKTNLDDAQKQALIEDTQTPTTGSNTGVIAIAAVGVIVLGIIIWIIIKKK